MTAKMDAGAAQRAAAAVMAPSSILIPGAEYVHLLGMGGEIEDLLVRLKSPFLEAQLIVNSNSLMSESSQKVA